MCSKSFFLFIALLLLSGAVTADAQTIPGLNPSSDLAITASPEVPQANQDVTLEVTSFYVDLNRSTVGWYINDKLYQEGVALKKITIKSGAIGTRTKVGAVVFQGTKKAIQYFYISPASVDILWQAKTYVPPLYQGKALYTNQSDVLFYAVIDFPGYKPSDVVYEWSRNHTVANKGRGMETVVFPGRSIADTQLITVNAVTSDQKFSATKTIQLVPSFPEILVYEDNPITGFDFGREAGRAANYPVEFTLASFPFGFSTQNRFSNSSEMFWIVNGTPVSEQNTQSALFRKEGSGSANIIIRGNTDSKPLQFASKRYEISLEQ